MMRSTVIFAICMGIGIAGPAQSQQQPAPASGAMPHFRYETDWIKLPAGMTMGEVTAVAVDRRDHVWVLHRPRSVKDRPAAEIAGPIVEFGPGGQYIRSFGGPSDQYEWPSVEHSLAVAANGDIWVSGSLMQAEHGDDMLLVFGRDGRFLRQIGKRGASQGNGDDRNFKAPADIFIDDRAREVYVADGYGNQRIVVLSKDGRFHRKWGAFGKAPPESTAQTASASQNFEGGEYFKGVHGVERSRDGLVYVSDRQNQRIQVFTASGQYRGQIFVNRDLKSPFTTSGITFSRDRSQKYLFAADWGNGMIAVIDRKAMRFLGNIGSAGTEPGQFKGPHLIDTDSKGVIYVAEVQGRRLQRLIPAGNSGAATNGRTSGAK